MQGDITTKEPLVVVLPDNIEGNVKFNFYLKANPDQQKSYSELHVVARDEANIAIYNAPINKQTSVKEDISVGTYQNKYNLYLNYRLYCQTKEDGIITVNFYIEEK